MKNHMKGQITFVNIIAIFATLIIYFMLYPSIDQFAQGAITTLNTSGNPQASFIIMLIQITPAVVLFGIFVTVFNMAIPQREGQYRMF